MTATFTGIRAAAIALLLAGAAPLSAQDADPPAAAETEDAAAEGQESRPGAPRDEGRAEEGTDGAGEAAAGEEAGASDGAEGEAATGDEDGPLVVETEDGSVLDDQTYEGENDDFIPSEEIPVDEPIPFPSDI
jgi:hypothetical protein